MSITEDSGPPASAISPVLRTVFRLHWWRGPEHTTELFYTHDSALASLATYVRRNWDDINWREDAPGTPDDLTDAEAVRFYYGGAGGGARPTYGECDEDGFEIVEDFVGGPAPTEVTLRLANLRVLDRHPDNPTVTGCLTVQGVTVAVTTGPDAYPLVLIKRDTEQSGLPITVQLDTPNHL